MPRSIQSRKDRDLARTITLRYINSAEERQPRVNAWDAAYDAHDPQYIDKTKVTRPPYVKVPYLHRVTEQQSTQLFEATDAGAVWLEARPTTPNHEDNAQAVTQWLDYQYWYKSANYNENNRVQHKAWGRMGLKYGNGYLYAEWVDDGPVGRVQCKNLDPRDVFLDARHGRFTIVRRLVTLGELGHLAQSISSPATQEVNGEEVEVPPRDGGRALRAFKKVERDLKKGLTAGWTHEVGGYGHGGESRFRDRHQGDGSLMTDESQVQAKDDPFNAMIVVLEYYENKRDGMIARVIPHFTDGESLILQRERNPYNCVPIVPFLPHVIDNEFYGVGNGEIVGKLDDAISYNFRATLSQIGALGWPTLLHSRRSQLRKNKLTSLYGAVVQVSDVNNDMAYLPTPQIGGAHQLGQQVAQTAADFGTGETAARRGDVGGAKTATAIAVAESAGSVTDRNIFSQWRDSNEQLGYVMLNLARVHASRTQMVPALGRNDGSFYELKPEFLREAQWAVTFGGNARGSNTTQQAAYLLNVVQAGAQTGVIDLPENFRELYRLGGYRNTDKFLTVDAAVPPLTPEEEFKRLVEKGDDPQISQSENTADHVEKHGLQLQQLAQIIGTDHPRYHALFAHWQTTSVLFQQQQLAAQSPTGSGGGPSALQPGQVGGAGQPAVLNPATADINQQRNGSNVAAGGAAPGGVVPNRAIGSVVQGGPQR